MIFFDENNPNKYRELKKLLVPKDCNLEFKRFGSKDGSYVLPANIQNANILSYGIGSDPNGVSFEKSLDKDCNILHMYDGSIDSPPIKFDHGVFYKEYLTESNFKDHINKFTDTFSGPSILKMDIEGNEYDWLTKKNEELLYYNFDIFAVELHSLIQEIPDGWVLEPQLLDTKQNPNKPLSFLKRLNEHFFPWHIHGNNHSPRYVDFPDSLEVTFLNRAIYGKNLKKRKEKFPLDIDEPNFDGRPDYVLDWWL